MRDLKQRRSAGSVIIVLLLAIATLPTVALGDHDGNMNSPDYWEAHYPNAVECYSHSGNSSHGSITNDGKAVTLNEFQDSWPGDRWEALIIKGGNATYTDPNFGEIVDGNRVIELPSAGTPYFAPENEGGNTATVSHWIVCKGETPPDTTEPEDTTTTEPEDTTTTEPEDTTTTTEEEVAGETTSTTEADEEVAGETTSTTETEVEEETTSTTEDDETEDTLPFTGIGTDGIALAALIALASGAGLIFLTRRSAESEIDG